MSLKAGRVGVNPADVDPIDGHINPSSLEGYTKEEADAKFETQTHAANTYETKTEATLLQPKTLAVPISMLDGSKLTVESALQGLDNGKGSFLSVSESAVTNIIEGGSVEGNTNNIFKQGNCVWLYLYLQGLTASPWDVLCKIPAGYRPKQSCMILAWTNTEDGYTGVEVSTTGNIACVSALNNNKIRIALCYYVD